MTDLLDPGAELYDRIAVVDVGPGGATGLRVSSYDAGELETGEGLRVAFDVQKTIQSDVNKARIQIYNLSADSRPRIGKGDVVRLRVGYASTPLELAYEGEVTRVVSDRSGPSIITTIEAGDGVETFKAQDAKATFPAGTKVRAVIEAVAKKFTESIRDEVRTPVFYGKAPPKKKPSRLSTRNLDRDLAALESSLVAQGFATTLRRSLSVAGNAREAMDALGRQWRFMWSVQDGALQIVAYGATLVGEAILLSPESGLLGIPAPLDFGVKLTSRIIPGLRPGTAIVLRASTLSGKYIAESVHFTGDTRGQEWTAEIEARNMEGTAITVLSSDTATAASTGPSPAAADSIRSAGQQAGVL